VLCGGLSGRVWAVVAVTGGGTVCTVVGDVTVGDATRVVVGVVWLVGPAVVVGVVVVVLLAVAVVVGDETPPGTDERRVVNSSSIARCDMCSTSFGATPLATCATAANASETATRTPATQTPAKIAPRFTP